ncbi:MAG: PPC domain-containing protein [Anaerolineae bacterium]|nr:PPC domain-containing protein [Anaerolineae bacterium]
MAAPLLQDAPVELAYGQTIDGDLGPDQPSAFFRFDARAGDMLVITMTVTGGSLDPFLVLNGADRTPLAMDDNGGGERNARLTYEVVADGSYTIQATHAGGIIPPEGGSFTLSLTATQAALSAGSESPGALAGAPFLAPLGGAGALSNELTRQSPLRLYWFEAAAGEQIVVMPQQMAEFQPLLALYDSAFNELGRAQPGVNLRATIASDGVYFLAVSLPGVGSAGGVFELSVDRAGASAIQEQQEIQIGQSLQGRIDGATPAVSYRFSGVAGDVLEVRMSRTEGDLSSYLAVLDENEQVLVAAGDDDGDGVAELSVVLPADGVYLIAATRQGQAEGTTTGSFVLELAAGGESAPVLPADYADLPLLAYGETVQGEISDARFMDIYVFLGEEGDPVTVELKSLDAASSLSTLDPFLVLLDDGRIPLAEHDDIVGGVERDSRLEFTLPRTAYYAIVATRFDQAEGTSRGPYSLSLWGPGGAPAIPALPTTVETLLARLSTAQLVSGEPIQAVFEKGAGLYTFTAFAGTLADIAVTTDPGLDVLLILADENLSELHASNSGVLTGVTIPATGKYLVLVAPRFGPADDLGRGYILALTLAGTGGTGAAPANGVRELAYGVAVNGAIGDNTTSQVYTFAGSAGERIQITMKASPGSSLDSYLELQDTNGAVVDANDDIVPGQVRDAQIATELPADGEYVVIASRYVGSDAPTTSGSYELLLERVGDSAEPEPPTAPTAEPPIVTLGYGETEAGEITADRYLRFYVFDGQAGDVVTIRLIHTSGNLDSVLHLYQSVADGWIEIASNDDSPAGGTYEALLGNIILPQTAKYLIAVSRYGLEREATVGTFTITLTRES